MKDGCGQKLPLSFAQYNPNTSFWKMSQLSFEIPGLSEQSSATFTASGSMQNGQLFERPSSAHRMAVNGSTFWPTPRASMGGHGIAWTRAETGEHRSQLEDYLGWMFINAGNKRVRGLQVNPQWTDWLMGFPINHTALDAQEMPSSQP